jgi:hypothetical protein
MCGNSSTGTALADQPVAQEVPEVTSLGTTLTLDAVGEDALANMQLRAGTLAGFDDRLTVGEVTLDADGRPTCEVGFDCASYDPPVAGQPDPAAVRDFAQLIEGVNADRCLFTGALIPR